MLISLMAVPLMAVHAGNEVDTKKTKCRVDMPYEGPETLQPLNFRDLKAVAIDMDRRVSESLAQHLQTSFAETVALTKATEASVSMYSARHGFWTHELSNSSADSEQIGTVTSSSPRLFWLASVGKMATSVLIAQLMEEKQLLAEDTLDHWLPNVSHAPLISIEHLLTHTSGLKNFNQIEQVINNREYQPPQQLLEIANLHEPDFCPGSSWYYSNTGYIALAMIAEQLDQQNYADIVAQRISKSLGLKQFQVLRPNNSGIALVLPEGRERKQLVAEFAGIHGAGSIVASTPDAMRFLAALLRGDLISDASLDDALATLYPLLDVKIGYGRGLMVMRFADKQKQHTWVGHSGGSEHGRALLIFDIGSQTYVSLALNANAPAEAITNTLLKTLRSYEALSKANSDNSGNKLPK